MKKQAVFFIAFLLVAFAVTARLLPHAPNATPLTTIAFVGAAYLGRRWGFVLPLLALGISDLFIGFYEWQVMASVYGSFALIGAISFLCKKYGGILSTLIGVAGSSFLFFLITNAAVWAFSPWYEKSTAGLLYAYELGIPFLRAMLTGDIVYSLAIFGVFELVLMVARIKRSPTQYGFTSFASW